MASRPRIEPTGAHQRRRIAAALLLLPGLAMSAGPASADLRATSLSGLLAESTVIVLARVTSREPSEGGQTSSGRAVLQAEQVLKGQPPPGPLALAWTDEVHDQRLPPPPAQVLLFLAERQGKLSATHYGRSYWTVQSEPLAGTSCRRYTHYRYPIDLLRLTAEQRRRWLQTLPRRGSAAAQQILCLDDLPTLLATPTPRSPR